MSRLWRARAGGAQDDLDKRRNILCVPRVPNRSTTLRSCWHCGALHAVRYAAHSPPSPFPAIRSLWSQFWPFCNSPSSSISCCWRRWAHWSFPHCTSLRRNSGGWFRRMRSVPGCRDCSRQGLPIASIAQETAAVLLHRLPLRHPALRPGVQLRHAVVRQNDHRPVRRRGGLDLVCDHYRPVRLSDARPRSWG